MSIEFRCNQCQKLLQTPDETAGRQAKCPQCGAIQPIPNAAPLSSDAPSSAASANPFASGVPGSPFASGVPTLGPASPSSSGGPSTDGNPYQSPGDYANAPASWSDPGYLYAYAADRLSAPATMLIVIGGFGLVVQLLSLVGSLASLAVPNMIQPGGGIGMEALLSGGIGLVFELVGLSLSVVIILGGMKMKSLASYTWAMTGAILALVPCLSPCCLLGIPMGIWAIVVLNDPLVRSAFRT